MDFGLNLSKIYTHATAADILRSEFNSSGLLNKSKSAFDPYVA